MPSHQQAEATALRRDVARAQILSFHLGQFIAALVKVGTFSGADLSRARTDALGAIDRTIGAVEPGDRDIMYDVRRMADTMISAAIESKGTIQ